MRLPPPKSHFSREEFLCFTATPNGSDAKCDCGSTVRNFESAMEEHLGAAKHKKWAAARSKQPLIEHFVRPVAAADTSKERIFQYLNIAHLLCAGHALSTPLFTPDYLAALRTYTPVGPRQMMNLVPDAATFFKKGLTEKLRDLPFSLLVDETPCKDGVGFVAVIAATCETDFAIHCQKLTPEQTMDGERLAGIISSALQSWQLPSARFVALVEDNVRYGITAHSILQRDHTELIRVGCLSHTLSLFATASAFSDVHKLLSLLRSLVSDSRGKPARVLQTRFLGSFNRSSAILDYVETRWSEWLNTLFFVSASRESLFTWICLQKDRIEAELAARTKSKVKLLSIRETLLEIASMLDSVRLRAQLVLLCDLTNPVARFIEESQLKDVVALSRKAAQMFDYVVLLRDRLKPAFLSNYVTGLLSDELLVVRDDVSAWYRVAAERGLQKWKKWSGMAERYLRAVAVLDLAYWCNGREFPPDYPHELAFLFVGGEQKTQARLQWMAVGRTPHLQQLVKSTTIPAASLAATITWWRAVALAAPAPLFAWAAEHILSVRPGIAEVERVFSRLRRLDSDRRQRALPETLADEFFIVANSQHTDMWAPAEQ